MPSTRRSQIDRVARDVFGWNALRPPQIGAIEALLAGRDTLVVMPTGSGKSAVYQVAAMLIDRPTVVVSPLIALQRDQVAHLADTEAPEAVAVNSAQSDRETDDAWQSVRAGTAEFIFLSPEQLANPAVVERLVAVRPSLLVVDEAHCVSSWGHDFRPDYLRIADVVEPLGRPVVVALTATASPPVRAEIVDRLRLVEPVEVVRGFDRPGIHLTTHRFVDDDDKRAAVLAHVAASPGPGLVYAATRKDTERYAEALVAAGSRAAAFHAGMRAAARRDVHEGFFDGRVDVVVATSAFGMGIDKPDVRYVVHAAVTESIDSYYQQIGRAGRDGGPAQAVLCFRPEDLGLRRFFAAASPDEPVLVDVARALAGSGPTTAAELVRVTGRPRARVVAALNLFEATHAVTVTRTGATWHGPDIGEIDTVAAAVADAVEVAQARGRVERSRLEMMRGYAETTGCRRQFLLGYFGEHLSEPCGNCDTCDDDAEGVAAGDVVQEAPLDPRYPVDARVEHAEWGTGVVMRPEPDRITVLFEQVGYRTLSLAALDDHRLLTVVDAPDERESAWVGGAA